jgi:hypothetical protein
MPSLKFPTFLFLSALFATTGFSARILLVGHPADDPSAYNVVWNSPSADARGSMPLGNGDVGINAWVEPSGDLLFYIGKTDSWEENNRLAKIGLVRIRLAPALLAPGTTFRQELRLISGEIVITATPPASTAGRATGEPVTLHLWVDANEPVINVTVDSLAAVTATASFELWRSSPTTLPSIEMSDVQFDHSIENHQHAATVVDPDTVLRDLPSGIGWYHRNERSVGPAQMMQHQDLLEAPWHDPILYRTFGAMIAADREQRLDDQHLVSPAGRQHHFQIHVLTLRPATAAQWLATIQQQAATYATVKPDRLRAAHEAWWRTFWARSHITLSARADTADTGAPVDVARGYTLQRFITAAGGRGAYPIKYNGSIFTVPWPGKPGDADYRRWGPGYWWQNTRLAYAPLCTSGDFDLLAPFHKMYAGEVMAVSRYRTKRYFGFDDAAYFPECVYPWGAVFPESYGWEQPATARRTDKLQVSRWHKWEWVGGLEFAFMLQDYFDHTGDERFLRETLLPTALPLLRFFDKFYSTGSDGKLLMHPAQAAETWWDCTNPMTEIAGLHAVIGRLLALPHQLLPVADRAYLEKLRAKLPPLPTREVDGVRMLAAAAQYDVKKNVENPELYAVFPFRLVSYEKPNAALGIEALNRRQDRGAFGWRHEDIFMAYLGRTEEARDYVVQRARAKDPACRFPAFWGPNYDWTPDQCHGGVLMKSVQAMLLQTEGNRIFLLPAWPAEWNVDFKLHAPGQTVIEGEVRDGRLVTLHVTPKSRSADIVLPAGYSLPGLTILRK